MNEDAQPNERPFNRKGGGVPIIRSTRPIGKGGSHRSGYGHSAPWPHPSRPINGPHPGNYHFPPSHHQQQHHTHRPHQPYDGSYQKRRRTNAKYFTDSSPRKVPANVSIPQTPFVAQKRTQRKAQLDPLVEPLIEIPPGCNEEVPVIHRSNMDWQRLQSQIVSVKSDVQVLLDGYPDNGTQSAILCPRSAKGRTTLNQEGTVPTPDASAIESPGTSSKANPKNDEIIIVENVDELVEHQDLLLPISPVQTNYEPHMRYPSPLQLPESAQSKTHELNEPIYVVKSGVLSLSSQGDGGHFAFETWPSTASPASWNASDGSVFSDYITSMILDQPEPDKESASLPSTTSKKPAVGRRACSTGRIQASFNYDIENQERPTIDEPFVRYELTLEDPCLRLTLSQSDKIRRLLQLDATTALAVSMRGSVDLIDTALLKHQRTLKTPTSGESIDAACILRAGDEYVTIFGHARDAEQVSWRRAQHGTNQSESRHLVRPWNTAKKGGVSATTSMIQPLQFATGGYDHVVHLWDVKPDLSSASHRQLAIKHTSLVQSLLAIRDTSHKLVSAGADCNVHFWDLASERVVNTLRPSNATYHIHKTTSPFCTLLEIAHRELQFEVRDHRLVPESPVLRFGYNTNKVHGRFIKGATSSDLFACGSRDGSVRMWDLRNVKSAPITATIHSGQKIVQVIFEQSHLVACSEGGQISLVGYKSD